MCSPALKALAHRFPQLYLAPMEGRSQSEEYRGIVRKGHRITGSLEHFTGSLEDRLWTEQTPAGEVQVLFLKNRRDFVCCYQIMACRCEPKEVPDTMGAVTISGLNDWSRIHDHLDAWEAAGNTGRAAEQRRFTANPENYKTTLILLSEGNYSALPAEKTPYSRQEWTQVSYQIRLYHELTHFVCRRKFPQLRHAVFDELLADCIGLVHAVGSYPADLARAFLGIDGEGRYCGGRLENYVGEGQSLTNIARAANRLIGELENQCEKGLSEGLGVYNLMLLLAQQAPEMIAAAFENRLP